MLMTESRIDHRDLPERDGTEKTSITAAEAVTLCGLLRERVRRTPEGAAYLQFDDLGEQWVETTWRDMAREVAGWQSALRRERLRPGDRVAVMMRNRREWVAFDLAATGVGLVTVPLYPADRPASVRHILEDAGVRLLLLERRDQLEELRALGETLQRLERLLVLEQSDGALPDNARQVCAWLAEGAGDEAGHDPLDWVQDASALATIVYTSGTTGAAKGVMLSHRNLLWNAEASMALVPVYPDDCFLSFLPLSHTLERTAGSILPIMAGASVAFARSIPHLAEDLQAVGPTALFAVPRIFERIHARIRERLEEAPPVRKRLFDQAVSVGWHAFEHAQGRAEWTPELLAAPFLDRLVGRKVRAQFGGRLRVAVCGGAPLPPEVARVFIALGVPIVQGYGLTETSPVISVNRLEDNQPESVGELLPGIEARIGKDEELLVRTPGAMIGYWGQPDATAMTIDRRGWLHTGDRARLDGRRLSITGRLKEILVLDNGEKIAPADLEMAIATDPLIEQVLVFGDGMPFLSALVVLNEERRAGFVRDLGISESSRSEEDGKRFERALLERIEISLAQFPGYARIRAVIVEDRPWSIEQGLMTPTMKLKRGRILRGYEGRLMKRWEANAA